MIKKLLKSEPRGLTKTWKYLLEILALLIDPWNRQYKEMSHGAINGPPSQS